MLFNGDKIRKYGTKNEKHIFTPGCAEKYYLTS